MHKDAINFSTRLGRVAVHWIVQFQKAGKKLETSQRYAEANPWDPSSLTRICKARYALEHCERQRQAAVEAYLKSLS